MEFKRIEGANCKLAENQDEYTTIWIRRGIGEFAQPNGELYKAHYMEFAVEPTPAELERLNAGAPVIVRILGLSFPPINVWAGDAPSE